MKQIELFEEKDLKKNKGITIPKKIVSPIESESSINSDEYKLEFFYYKKFLLAIQSHHGCTFLVAREMFFEHRDKGIPIEVDESYFF